MRFFGHKYFPVLFIAALGSSGSAMANDMHISIGDILARDFPYSATEISIERALLDMGSIAGFSILPSEDLSGTVSVSNARGSVEDALDMLAGQVPIVWWFDGAAIHVEPSEATVSELLPLGLISADELEAELRLLDLWDPRFSLRASSRGNFVRLVAPAGYVSETEALVAEMNKPRLRQVRPPQQDGDEATEYALAGLPIVLRGQR